MFRIIIVLLLLSGAVRGDASQTVAWKISKANAPYVKIENQLLIVDVPAGMTNVCAYATADVDLSDWNQTTLETEIRCRGERVVRDPRPARGVKLSVHYWDPLEKGMHYPAARAPEEGDFGWTNLVLSLSFGEVAPPSEPTARVVLGLQQTSGRLVFDLSSFKLRKAPPVFPLTDNEFKIQYPSRHVNRRPLRGVMGRGGSRNTEQDIEDLKNYGATLVRLQMNSFHAKKPKKGAAPKTLADWDRWLSERLDHAEQVLGWLEARQMKMVLDLHNPPVGGYGKDCTTFTTQAHADRFISAWEEIARRFKGRPGIYGYDLINEPAQKTRALPDCDYWNLQRRAAEAIRAIDPDVTIVVAANDWSAPQAFSYLRALEMDNVIYQVHMYKPGWYTHQGANGSARPAPEKLQAYPNPARGVDKNTLREYLRPVREFQLRHNAKIFVGEFSASIYAPGAGAYLADCISIFNEYGWDWTYHSFREAMWWNVETVLDEQTGRPVPNKDNDRFRALTEGFTK